MLMFFLNATSWLTAMVALQTVKIRLIDSWLWTHSRDRTYIHTNRQFKNCLFLAHLKLSDCKNKLQLLLSLRQSRSVIPPTDSLANNITTHYFLWRDSLSWHFFFFNIVENNTFNLSLFSHFYFVFLRNATALINKGNSHNSHVL